MVLGQAVQVICGRITPCGFRVGPRYFVEKRHKFVPGICPRCGGPLSIVKAFTDTLAPGYVMVVDPQSPDAGAVFPSVGGAAAYIVAVAAATAVVGYNLLTNSEARQSTRQRVLVAASLTGSAAAGDAEVELKAGSRTIAKLANLATGYPTKDHFLRVGEIIAPNEELGAFVLDAPATNALILGLDFA